MWVGAVVRVIWGGVGREGDCRTYDNDFLRYCSKYKFEWLISKLTVDVLPTLLATSVLIHYSHLHTVKIN